MSKKFSTEHLPVLDTGVNVLNKDNLKEVIGWMPTIDPRIDIGKIDIAKPIGELEFLVGSIENARRDGDVYVRIVAVSCSLKDYVQP